MPLKYKCKTKDEIPAEHLPLYAERDGAWVLDVDGAVEKSKLDEFRNTNVSLIKERDDLKKRYEGIDPDAVKALADEKRQLEEAQQLKAGEVEKVVENRIKGVKADLEKQIATLTTERDAMTGRLTSIQIDQGVLTVATKRGLRPTAIPDITVAKIPSEWKIQPFERVRCIGRGMGLPWESDRSERRCLGLRVCRLSTMSWWRSARTLRARSCRGRKIENG